MTCASYVCSACCVSARLQVVRVLQSRFEQQHGRPFRSVPRCYSLAACLSQSKRRVP